MQLEKSESALQELNINFVALHMYSFTFQKNDRDRT
jgi:hypothetical protein